MTDTPPKNRPSGASRQRWLDEGLQLVAVSGIGAVTIDALCERLALSKGSFYHHFKGMAGYRIALLERFDERETQSYIDMVERLPMKDGAEKLRALGEATVVHAADDTLEGQFRAWASHDPLAREYLERVDTKRTDYLKTQCRHIVDDRELADDVAVMIYLLTIGATHVLPPVHVRDQARMWDRLINYLEQVSASKRN